MDLQQTGGINSTLALPRSGKAPRGAPVEMDLAASRGGANLLDHIKNLRTKRFLEIYYVAYRNLHFFERPDEGGFDRPSTSTAGTLSGALHGEDVAALHVPPSGGPGGETSSASEGAGDQATSMASRNVVTTSNKVENHIKPLFDRIGYNQSIFLL